ncbi:MAG: site-2 protease family protein [Candidatus Micrarchaeota archaeon]|nr:site-2 protease family protein [Candidatus Micrarchaeota archaeon]
MIPFLLILLSTLLVFYAVLNSQIAGMYKFILIVAEMVIVGTIFIKRYKLTGEHGLILLRSKHGLNLIDKLAKNENAWKFFADVGAVMGYGLLSFIIMKKNVSWKALVTGMALLGLISIIVAPYAFLFLSTVIKDIKIEKPVDQVSTTAIGNNMIVFVAMLLFGGLFLLLLTSLLTYSTVIISALLSTVLYGTTAIQNTTPGATFLLPGLNLPFFEAIIALFIILVVHEGSHAVLARVAKIPVLSSGIVLFGILPVGAFVEPDEAKLNGLEKTKQTRVLVAGSTANLLTSMLFFILFMGFLFVVDSLALKTSAFAGAAKFIYLVLGLTFSLNFIIGTVNLLPLPFFDGYRILEVNIPQKKIVDGLMAITLVAFLANFIPWLFK